DASGNAGWLGFVWMGVAIAMAAGSRWAEKYPDPKPRHLAVFMLVTSLLIAFAALEQSLLAILLGFVLHEITREVFNQLLWTYANQHIRDGNRTMMNSIRGSLRFMGAAVGLLAFTPLSTDPLLAWLVAAAVLLLLSLFILMPEFKLRFR